MARVSKSKKGGTRSTRQHSYQSFSQKIANLKIDPVRRVRRQIPSEALTTSFFQSSLESWADLNLSGNFLEFAREISPLSDSLPHILHHKSAIFTILTNYIQKRDIHSLEPLLSLLTHLAHDLGASFEPFFQDSILLLSSLVSKSSNTEAQLVEWTFNALAYLFKYLSRLLVPDLRPLYAAMSPLLGKTPQKWFVSGFAAEAVGFLVRKCAREGVKDLVRFVFEDLVAAGRGAGRGYLAGVIRLFREACVGVGREVHSKGGMVLGVLVEVLGEVEGGGGVCREVVEGVVVALVHHTNEETFGPVLEAVCGVEDVAVSARLVFLCATVRKGGRIKEWCGVADVAVRNVKAAAEVEGEKGRETMWIALKAAVVVLQTADIEVVIARIAKVVDCAKEFQDGGLFLPFCEFFADMGVGRFKTFLLSYLQRFITSKWLSQEDNLCLLIPKLSAVGALGPESEMERSLVATILGLNSPIPIAATASIQEFYKLCNKSDDGSGILKPHAVRVWQYLNMILALSSGVSKEQLGNTLPDALFSLLYLLLKGIFASLENLEFAALAGKALSVSSHGPSRIPLEGSLSAAFPRFGNNAVFLKGALHFLSVAGAVDGQWICPIADKLVTSLSSAEHDVRSLSLRCLAVLHAIRNPSRPVSEVISTAKTIEDTPLVISNSRNISLYIRRLASGYAAAEVGSWERKIVPWYCFGLLTVQFASVWEDATAALAKVAEVDEGVVEVLSFEWLERQHTAGVEEETGEQEPGATGDSVPSNGFECPNLKVVEEVAGKCVMERSKAVAGLESKYEDDLRTPTLPVSVARMQALRVLTEIPRLAEKRSRKLVPMFLDWTRMEDSEDAGDDEQEEAKTAPTKWLRKEQAAMLTLFTKFENPRALYKAELVYAALLNLLASGDPGIQSLALKCIFTWRIPAVKTYEDNLVNLLDDTRFRDEVTHFVQMGQDESMIQDGHREKLMPVLLRLLYGRSLSRKNASSGRKGMESKRTIVLAALAHFHLWEREMFIDIALGKLSDATGRLVEKTSEKHSLRMEVLESVRVSNRKQMGFVRMAEDMVRQLGSTLLPFAEKIVDALLYCLVSASKTIRSREDSMENLDDPVVVKASRAIRQEGLKCLNALFARCPTFAWIPYMPAIFDELVNPRLDALPVETSQNPSGLLQVFSTWASSKDMVMFLADYNPQVLPKISQCLSNKSVKDEVLLFILRLVKNIIATVDSEGGVGPRLLESNAHTLLVNMEDILRKNPVREVLEQAVEAIAKLAPFVSGNTETTHLVEILVFLLNQPPRRVSPKARSDILKILLHFLPLCVMGKEDKLYQDTFRCVSSLFSFFKDREGRETLAGVLNVFAERDEELIEVAVLSRQLNSFSPKRLDEPDFEQRLAAYAKINEELYMQFSPKQWMPLLFNMLFFIRDNNELAIRTNAAYTLNRFVESCGRKAETGEKDEYLNVLSETIMPAMKSGVRDQSELVRAEHVGVVAHIIKHCGFWDEVSDMKPLLADGDEEASFFNNILHIQQHRRTRALRRLAITAQKGGIRDSNIAHFFVPLLEHFVFDQAEDAHNLASHTVVAIGALAEQLTWMKYRALFKRYSGYLKSKPDSEKIAVRLIGVVVDALPQAAATNETPALPADGDGDTPMETPTNRLAVTLPEQQVLAEDISKSFLPALSDYLHQKEESTVSLRVPIAVSIAKLLKAMPDDMLRIRLPPVLTDVCHILRSRAQESRDMTRKTLTEITTLLGSQYFGFVLKELRGALLRGYQLHVLSFTVHSILVSVTPTYSPGALDYCLAQIVTVVMDDIFGVTGLEKDAEGYTSSMKEVKSSKSYDSMELMASTTALPFLGTLVRPIHALLKENMNLKMARKIDELLRRITVGLLRNKEVESDQILVFCYEVIQEGYKEDSRKEGAREVDPKIRRYLVNLKAPSNAASAVSTSSHTYKLTRFALDLLRTILQKHGQLMTPSNLSGFIPTIGDALLSKQEEIQTSALRLLTTIIRTPLPSIDEGAGVFVGQALSFVKSCPSMNAELAQASLKLMTAILRGRRDVQINETTIGYLLKRIKPDLEEPDRQGIAFNFLKAVMTRKIVIPEVYEVLDTVAAIMVTDQTKSVRDLARSCYFQFLMEYPQGKERLNKQLGFLFKNLDYVHQSGRQSVLEAVNLLVTRVGNNLIQNIVGMFFVPLVMRLINDDSVECREMTGVLLKKLLESADQETLQTFVGLIKNWLSKDDSPLLIRAALQVFGLYLDAYGKKGEREVPFVIGKLQKVLQAASEDVGLEWELIYFALQTWIKIVQLFPEPGFSPANSPIWLAVRKCLVFPHAWVRLSAARLMGLLFAEYAKSPLSEVPLDNGRGLQTDGADMIKLARSISSQLNNAELSDELGLQVVKNLLFLGRCFYANNLPAISSIRQNDQELDDIEEDRDPKSALSWLIGRISGVIRSERNIKKGLRGKKYALQWLAAITQVISSEDLQPLATKIIMPLYGLVGLDDMHLMKELKPTAQEILNMVQSKVGTTAYVQAYNAVREEVSQRRQERRNKRSIQTVTDPEKAAKYKIRKHEKKRVARKGKAAAHKEARRGKAM